jgi:signal transduction histidine kinase
VLLAKTFRSTTFKLALVYIAIFGALVVGLIGYVYWSAISFARARSDETAAVVLTSLGQSYASAGREALIAALNRRIADRRLPRIRYLLADPTFKPLAGNLANWPEALKGASGGGAFRGDDHRQELRGSFTTLPDGSHLLVACDMGEFDAFVQKIKGALALCAAMIFTLAGVASVTVTRRTVGRIEAINATSQAIMRSGLGQRIPLRGTDDEWDELSANLNSMLDRIEALMEQVKQVTDNVAHDLRTPLARLRGRLEKAAGRLRDGDADQALIGDALSDLDGVLRMFASLTRIAQIEARRQTAAFRPVNLVEIAGEVVELFDAAAEESGVRLKSAGDRRVFVLGDRDLLFDAVANLVDNAIKHGRAAGRVIVEVKNGDGAVLSIADDGPGIPVDQRPHVFERFYRLERSRSAPGNGLGLSLVAAVARLHGARIEMMDNAPGLKVQLTFYVAPRPDQLDSVKAQV